MANWKQLGYGLFCAIGVTAFLAVVANEIECLNYELGKLAEDHDLNPSAVNDARESPKGRQAA